MSVSNIAIVLIIEELDEWHKAFQSKELHHARELHNMLVSLVGRLKIGLPVSENDGRRKPWSDERKQKVGARVRDGWALRRASQPFKVQISGSGCVEVCGYDNLRKLIYGDIKHTFRGTFHKSDTPYLSSTMERQVKTIKNGLSGGSGVYSTVIIDSGDLDGTPITITRLPMPTTNELRAAIAAAVTGSGNSRLISTLQPAKPIKPSTTPSPLNDGRPKMTRAKPKFPVPKP